MSTERKRQGTCPPPEREPEPNPKPEPAQIAKEVEVSRRFVQMPLGAPGSLIAWERNQALSFRRVDL